MNLFSGSKVSDRGASLRHQLLYVVCQVSSILSALSVTVKIMDDFEILTKKTCQKLLDHMQQDKDIRCISWNVLLPKIQRLFY